MNLTLVCLYMENQYFLIFLGNLTGIIFLVSIYWHVQTHVPITDEHAQLRISYLLRGDKILTQTISGRYKVRLFHNGAITHNFHHMYLYEEAVIIKSINCFALYLISWLRCLFLITVCSTAEEGTEKRVYSKHYAMQENEIVPKSATLLSW